MTERHQLILKTPVSELNSILDIDLKGFIANTIKLSVAASFGEASDTIEYGSSALKALRSKVTPEQVAWQLVMSSFLNAFSEVANEYKDLLQHKVNDEELIDLTQRVEHQLNVATVSINNDFFKSPQDISLFEEFKPALTLWLSTLGLNGNQAISFQHRLKEEFPLTLHNQWGKDQELYKCIVDALDSPFKVAVEDKLAWKKYSLWLQKEANNRVFDEAFGLREVYIPLRAYYETKDKDAYDTEKHVCDLHSTVLSWLSQFDKGDSLKVISGGPGAGKSSAAKILTAEIIEQKIAPVLFIPLHHFNLSNNLIEAVGDFINDTPHLKNNPLHQDFIQDRLILIFDGLDELSEQGQAAKAAAEQFIDGLIRELDRKNDNHKKWQAIITGRDLSIQDNQHHLKKPKQVLHLLPYHIEDYDHKKYQGESALIGLDQRSLWWEKFGHAKGCNYTSIPTELDRENLHPITKEPLLNYLVALSYERKTINFNDSTSLNRIYYDLLQAVYDRNYADGRQSAASKHLTFEQFLEVLEEIALAVWHGNGRTASESYLLKRCTEAGVAPYLEKFSESAKKGVVKLLTAFYFREFETNSANDRTFEFTHKSFGEYLTAKHIIRSAVFITEEFQRHEQNHKVGWNEVQALEKWIELTGPSLVDYYLLQFINNEVKELSQKQQIDIQQVFIKLLTTAINNASPLESFRDLNFAQMLEHSKNSETALLITHCACALEQKTPSKILFKTENKLRDWIKRIGLSYSLCASFQHLDLSSSILNFENLLEINFSYSTLNNAYLNESTLAFARFQKTSLKNTNLARANFFHATLEGANLEGANLEGANLVEANLMEANLNGADLNGADLLGACLRGANLTGANFAGANLMEADLEGATITATQFQGASLEGAKLENTNHEDSNFKGTNLERTILEDTYK